MICMRAYRVSFNRKSENTLPEEGENCEETKCDAHVYCVGGIGGTSRNEKIWCWPSPALGFLLIELLIL